MRIYPYILLACLLYAGSFLAQKADLDEVEQQLSALSKEVLLHQDLSHKIKQNKAFSRLLIETLKRPESYEYDFDSLKTISILRAGDNSFRLFTWHIVDRNRREVRGEQYHYYFGLVQRRYQEPGKEVRYLVIPLLEMPQISGGVENEILSNERWLGAQYYPLRYGSKIPKYSFRIRTPKIPKNRDKRASKTLADNPFKRLPSGRRNDSIYVIGKGWNKQVSNEKRDLYLLLGWNGGDDQTNYKVVELLSFDPKDPERVIFGAGVFYFDNYAPKQRAVFKYTENAPFFPQRSLCQDRGPFWGP